MQSKMEGTNMSAFLRNNTVANETKNQSSTLDMPTFDKTSSYILRLLIDLILLPIIIIVGIIGNVLTVKIFRKKKDKPASSIFIISLAVSDTMLLVCKLIYTCYTFCFMFIPHLVVHIPIRAGSWLWLAVLPERMGKLLVIGIMSERVFAVFLPLRLKQVWTKGRTHKLIAAIVIIVLITSLPPYLDILYFGFVYDPKGSVYDSSLHDSKMYLLTVAEWSAMLQFINRIIFDLVSLVIIFILCFTAVLGVIRMVTFNGLSLSDFEVIRRRKKERKITMTMLTMSSLLLLLCSPLDIFGVLIRLGIVGLFNDVSLEVTSLLHMFLLMNSMVNFIVYGVVNKQLRREYINNLMCCRCSGRKVVKASDYRIRTISQTAKT